MVVDYRDGIVESYGAAEYCQEYAPGITHNPNPDLRNPTELLHTY